ncbi:MAG TPA: proton-conducting transporter membrane subunit, partial [Elusimicrobiota bacterium]|nr:proton-conducting transporter membrane subunit [Elusimicrobiota bacterium]
MRPLPPEAVLLLAAPLAALTLGWALFHRLWPRKTHIPILVSCAVVTGVAWSLAWRVLAGGGMEGRLFSWVAFGRVSVDFGLRVDGLSASVLAMVSLVGTLIHVYAAGYMEEDPGFSRFFLYFHLFFFFMIGLLLSSSYLQLYVFWEGVGLASFLLIGFWWHKESARAAAWKAFLVNRVGDAGFLVALLLMLGWTGTTRFEDVFARLPYASEGAVVLVAALLFWGACAKSAQFPLYVWLPDAMEGPTPVSALMHAATMVTAGVFLMARSWPLLERAPAVASAMAGVGAFTAAFAAFLAASRRDLKRILAYSTVSHLGLMIMSLGLGNLVGAVLHLIAHGFFKAA